MARTLYQLVDTLKILEQIEPEDEEQEARLRQTIPAIKMDIEQKVINIAQYLLSIKREAEVCKAEEDRLKARRQAIHNRYEWLKSYLYTEIRGAMLPTPIRTETITVTIQKSPPSVEIIDIDIIPKEFSRLIIEPKKKEILEYFKQTSAIPAGVNIITDKEHIVIR